ncbi:MAG: DUF6982 domain-containing protein [Bryobacteraceae bacterium]
MAPSTNKKVIIRRFDREPLAGYVNPQTYMLQGGIEMLDLKGTCVRVSWEEIKSVDFVRDFDSDDKEPQPRVFTSRPKTAGLWVRMRFRDGEEMEGLLANDLLQLQPHGFSVTPPNPGSRRQRVFVPRSALVEMRVLGVIGSAQEARAGRARARAEQMRLFE